MKKLNLGFAGLAAMLLAIFGMVSPAQAATNLGGLSVQAACSNQWPGTNAVLVANNVYGWKCRTYWSGGPVNYNVDLNRECRRAYGSGAYASYLDYNNPYSWRCWR